MQQRTQQKIQQQAQLQAQLQYHALLQYWIPRQIKEQVQPQIQHLIQNIHRPQRSGQPRSYWLTNMVRNAIAHRQAIFQDDLLGRKIKLYNFMTSISRINDIDGRSLEITFEVNMKVDDFLPFFIWGH